MKMPKSFVDAPATKTQARYKLEAKLEQQGKVTAAAEASTAVKARINMSAEVAGQGLCPECREPMVKMFANGIPVLTCMEDRITIPIGDEPNAEEHTEERP